MTDLFASLNDDQARLVVCIGKPFLEHYRWPLWSYVETEFDRDGFDARQILATLPEPSRSAAEAPDWPWSMPVTVIWSLAQPSATALPRSSYWRIADSVLCRTCLRLDCRTYSLNNPSRVAGSCVVTGHGRCTHAGTSAGAEVTSSSEEKLGDRFSTACPLSVVLGPRSHRYGPAKLDFPDLVAVRRRRWKAS